MDGAAAARRARRDTVGDAIGRAAGRFRDRVALRFGDRAWSYAALDAEAARLAAAFHAAGLGHGDRVVAFGRTSDRCLLCWIACCKAGLIHVPANYALSPPELSHIVRQYGARLLLTTPNWHPLRKRLVPRQSSRSTRSCPPTACLRRSARLSMTATWRKSFMLPARSANSASAMPARPPR